MNAGALIDFTRTLAGMPDVPPAHLLTLLNVVNDEVSRDLGVPIGTVDFMKIEAATDLQIPANGREEGLLELYRLTLNDDDSVAGSVRVPMWTFQQASEYEPNWSTEEPGGVPRFVVYDPSQMYVNPLPVPAPTAAAPQSFRMVYQVHPCEMEELADEPLDGRLPSFHDVIAYRAAFLLTRDAALMQEYEVKIRRARGRTFKGAPPVWNPLWSTTGAWRGGR